MRFFLILFLSLMLPLSFIHSAEKKGREMTSSEILEGLAKELPGGEFIRLGIRTGKEGAGSLYRGPSGMLLNLELRNRKTPPVTLEKAHKEKLLFVKTLKDSKGNKIPGAWLFTGKKRSFPGLAGRTLSGIHMQARLGDGKNAGRLDIFLALYRERLLQISFLLPEATIPPQAQERIFTILLSRVAQLLYEGEKASLAQFRKKLFFQTFARLMQNPENAAMECHAINKFVEKSSAVIVRIDPADFLWQKELLKKVPEGKKAFALLLNAYMGGNAAEQIKLGVCRDHREAGLTAMKKMYKILRQRKLLSMPIPELEK